MTLYQRIISVYAKLRAAINSKTDRVEISSKFSSGKIYQNGELVIYDDQIFICNTLHIGPWDPNHFALATVADALSTKADKSSIQSFATKSDIADEFRTSWNYNVGRLTIYNGALYRCIVYHPAGEWDPGHFSRANVDNVMGTKISQLEALRFADKTSICNEFDANQAYYVDDLVIHDGLIWRCATAHQGLWSSNDFVPNATVNEVLRSKVDSDEMSGKADKSSIAAVFSTSESYDVGRLVLYYGKIYRCTTAHTGTWNSGHFAVATVDDVLKTKITASDVADNASRSDIAPEFSTTTEYIAGELVYKEGALYKCIRGHEAGSWDAGDFSAADVNDALMYDSRAGVVDTTLHPGENYVELSSGTITQIDASQLTSLTVTPAIPPPVEANGRFKMTDMLLRVDTGSSACTITHGWAGPCICSNPDWNILPANAINILTYTYVGEVSQSNPDPVFLVGVVSRPIDQGSSS